jgi:8-oxo-dGTP pyrophosphatase MutT (NUDIX family)
MRRVPFVGLRVRLVSRLGKRIGMPDGLSPGFRVERGVRRQGAALPLFGHGSSLRVVLVTSRETRRWVLPKGWIEPGEPAHLGAAREAFEEAGLQGEAEHAPIGAYAYAKRLARGAVIPTEVLVFRFRVTRLLADWPERRERERRLFAPKEAAALVAEPELAALLRSLRPA